MDKSKNLKFLSIPFAIFMLIIAVSKFGSNDFFEKYITALLNGTTIILIMLAYFIVKKSKLFLHSLIALCICALVLNIYYFISYSIDNNNNKYLAMLAIIPFSGYCIHYYNEFFD